MSTIRQIEANRRNSQKSTGPTSVTGKAAASMNALKTGIHAKSLVLPSEKVADLEELIDEYYQRHQPASPEARLYVDDLIYCEWTLRRLRNSDAQCYKYQNTNTYSKTREKYPLGKSATAHPRAFTQLHWRLDSTRRAIDRALKALALLKAEAAAAPPVEPDPPAVVEPPDPPAASPSPQTASPQIGFVPSTPAALPNPASQDPGSMPLTPPPTLATPGCCRKVESRIV
jgi:hypothetical protein